MKIDKNEFSYRLRTAMKEKMVTAAKIASLCECHHSAAYHWMHGRSIPTEEKMQLIAEFLEVDVDWLKGKDMDKDLKKNAEGYTDPTAYKAMKNVLEGERMKLEHGQVYEYYWKDNQTKSIVVVSFNNVNSCVGIVLMDEPRHPRCIPVDLGDHVEYADPRTASYSPRPKIGNYICNATAEEMQNIQGELADVFGIPTPVGIDKLMNERMEMGTKIADLEKELDDRIEEKATLLQRIHNLEHQPALTDNTEVIRLQTERDIYKAQYEMLFERMMAR